MKRFALLTAIALATGTAVAKLPPPSDEAKAKAAEAAARTAHGNKVADFQLCKSMNATAGAYFAAAKKANKETKPPTATPDCVDPGPFVYPPPAAAPAPAPAPAVPPATAAPAKKT
ncbi:MAG TPA: hypothetical protein VFQ20_04785 [Burkholderiaceae bacterium]|nr:hypothetical protein [Burkholderiaceae bacterium]